MMIGRSALDALLADMRLRHEDDVRSEDGHTRDADDRIAESTDEIEALQAFAALVPTMLVSIDGAVPREADAALAWIDGTLRIDGRSVDLVERDGPSLVAFLADGCTVRLSLRRRIHAATLGGRRFAVADVTRGTVVEAAAVCGCRDGAFTGVVVEIGRRRLVAALGIGQDGAAFAVGHTVDTVTVDGRLRILA